MPDLVEAHPVVFEDVGREHRTSHLMARAVVTMNSRGQWLCRNVAESHMHAAGRWKAQYIQLTTMHACFRDKHEFMAACGFDRVAWIDGDAVIREDCPDLFDLVPRECIGGVRNFQGDTHDGDPEPYELATWTTLNRMFGLELPYASFPQVNGGVLVVTPSLHADLWRDPMPVNPVMEQAMITYQAARHDLPIHMLPREFNRIGETAWVPGQMTSHIQHLARYRWKDRSSPRRGRNVVLELLRWRTT